MGQKSQEREQQARGLESGSAWLEWVPHGVSQMQSRDQSIKSLATASGLDVVLRRQRRLWRDHVWRCVSRSDEARGGLWISSPSLPPSARDCCMSLFPEVVYGHVPCISHWNESRSVTCPFLCKHVRAGLLLRDDHAAVG